MKKSKIAIVVTGGYYYNWVGGTKFYDWLGNFVSDNEDFDPYIISWRPPGEVPEKVKNQLNGQIKYRENEGCDWGCYNFFINNLTQFEKEAGCKYEYAIFCHDDILPEKSDWPNKMIEHIEKNKYCITSFNGRYAKEFDRQYVNHSKNGADYIREVMSMCFCVKLNRRFVENCPFVTIPGRIVDYQGDMGCGVFLSNIYNTYDVEEVGFVCRDSPVLNFPDYESAVTHFKRGSKVRDIAGTSTKESLAPRTNLNLALSGGFLIKPGKIASHEKMNEKRWIEK